MPCLRDRPGRGDRGDQGLGEARLSRTGVAAGDDRLLCPDRQREEAVPVLRPVEPQEFSVQRKNAPCRPLRAGEEVGDDKSGDGRLEAGGAADGQADGAAGHRRRVADLHAFPVGRQLTLSYERQRIMLTPNDVTTGLIGRYVDVYAFADGRLEIRWKGLSFLHRVRQGSTRYPRGGGGKQALERCSCSDQGVAGYAATGATGQDQQREGGLRQDRAQGAREEELCRQAP